MKFACWFWSRWFLKVINAFSLCQYYLIPWKREWSIILTNLNPLPSRILNVLKLVKGYAHVWKVYNYSENFFKNFNIFSWCLLFSKQIQILKKCLRMMMNKIIMFRTEQLFKQNTITLNHVYMILGVCLPLELSSLFLKIQNGTLKRSHCLLLGKCRKKTWKRNISYWRLKLLIQFSYWWNLHCLLGMKYVESLTQINYMYMHCISIEFYLHSKNISLIWRESDIIF